jgi:hypothetical protein
MTAMMPIDAPWWWVPPRPEPPPDERVPPLIRGLLGAFLFEAGYLGMVDADGTIWEERWRSFGSRNAADLIRAAAQTALALEVLIGQRGTLALELIKRLANVAGIDDAQSVHDAVRDTLHVDDLPDRVLRDGLKRARQIIAREGRRNKLTRGS